MRAFFLWLLISEALLITPSLADESEDSPAEPAVELAVAEVAASDTPDRQIELTSGTEDGTAHWRPGLLGHGYIEARYHHFTVEHDGFIEFFDDSEQGMEATINLPFLEVDEYSGHLGIDALLSHRYLGLSGQWSAPPPDDLVITVERDSNVTQLGASFFVDHPRLGPVRPFVQLGLQYVVLTGRAVIDGDVFEYDDDAIDVFFAPGLEVDLSDSAAFRATFDFIPVKQGDSSRFLGDLILWPWDRVFLRSGIVAPFNGEGIGGTIGAGVVF